MADSETVHLSLLDNSHAFLQEASQKALAAESDARQWQFAIVNLVQSLELSLKALLHQIHPVLVFDNVDAPRNTVTPRQAIQRLENSQVGAVQLADQEKNKIMAAIDLRNRMIHSEFELKPGYATAKFFEVFAFVVHFQARYLKTEVEAVLSEEQLNRLIAIGKGLRELTEKAEQRMDEENIQHKWVWECPNCAQYTFVVQDDINTCYTCRYTEELAICPHCGDSCFEDEIEQICEDSEIAMFYGYSDLDACPNCAPKIKAEFEERVAQEDYYRWIDEQHHYNT